MARGTRTRGELIAASDHLQYEIMMVLNTAHLLTRAFIDEVTVKSALLESFTIHSRALLAFLYADNPRSDDVVAEDYASDWLSIRPQEPPTLASIHRRVGKEVAHLTYDRLSVNDEVKNWGVAQMAADIHGVLIQFLRSVPDDLFGHKMVGQKATLLNNVVGT